MTFTSFQEYLQTQRPILEDVFNKELAGLLGNIAMRDSASLMAALQVGKKIRGCLCLMVSEALGGTREAAIPRAVAVELIQGATLLHDDFVDQDTVRRGRPAPWTVEGARRAVLVGDVMFATAIKKMNDLGREDGLAVSSAIAQVANGALREPLDASALAGEIALDRLPDGLYDKIIHLKTGILFGTACRLGAIAAGADKEFREASYRYGLRIGEAYQIADDLKEVKLHLSARSIHPKQMVALAPPLLRFIAGIRGHILSSLEGRWTILDGPVLESFGTAAELMEDEIEHRLRSAVSEIEERFPNNGYSDLARRAPHDIIKMFNES